MVTFIEKSIFCSISSIHVLLKLHIICISVYSCMFTITGFFKINLRLILLIQGPGLIFCSSGTPRHNFLSLALPQKPGSLINVKLAWPLWALPVLFVGFWSDTLSQPFSFIKLPTSYVCCLLGSKCRYRVERCSQSEGHHPAKGEGSLGGRHRQYIGDDHPK